MSLEDTLVQAGFSPEDAKKLASDDYFKARNSNKAFSQISDKVNSIATVI